MGLLKYIDILIGLSVVMLLLSPLVAAGTQFLLWLRNYRPVFLQDGLTKLILQLRSTETALNGETAETIAKAVLTHPMIGRAYGLHSDARGEVIEREELIRILLEFAAGEGSKVIPEATKQNLCKVLAANGIADPCASLTAIRSQSQRLEKNQPDKPAHERLAKAIILAAPSDFVGKINNWFDQSMDRVTQRYALRAKIVTVVSALFVAVALQLDTVDLIKRLSMDDSLRKSLLDQAMALETRVDSMQARLQTNSLPDAKLDLETAKARRDEMEDNLAKLRAPSVSVIPDHLLWQKIPQATLEANTSWPSPPPKHLELIAGGLSYLLTPRWNGKPLEEIRDSINSAASPVTALLLSDPARLLLKSRRVGLLELRYRPGLPETNILNSHIEMVRADWPDLLPALPGVLISWALLSLGAPFWYDRLKDLLKLRPTLAGKEEAQRLDRQADNSAVKAK